MRPSAKPAEVAQVLLSRLAPKHPVDVEAIAEALELRIGRVNFTGLVGAMVPGADWVGGLINIDAKIRERGRQRFTIAHEIGHYMLLDKWAGPSVCSLMDVGTWSAGSSLERAADIFAAELLLPAEEVRGIVFEHGVTLKSAELIKSTFDVSLRAAAYRCVELTKEESALVVTVNGVVNHYKPSASWRYLVCTKCAVGQGTMARKLFDNPVTLELCGMVLPKAWASEIKYIEQGDELWEESVYQRGHDTILSFLTVLN